MKFRGRGDIVRLFVRLFVRSFVRSFVRLSLRPPSFGRSIDYPLHWKCIVALRNWSLPWWHRRSSYVVSCRRRRRRRSSSSSSAVVVVVGGLRVSEAVAVPRCPSPPSLAVPRSVGSSLKIAAVLVGCWRRRPCLSIVRRHGLWARKKLRVVPILCVSGEKEPKEPKDSFFFL